MRSSRRYFVESTIGKYLSTSSLLKDWSGAQQAPAAFLKRFEFLAIKPVRITNFGPSDARSFKKRQRLRNNLGLVCMPGK
jgi:hypothetical protein